MTISGTAYAGSVTVNTGDYREYTWLGTGTLNVTNNFTVYDTWNANFQPVLNVGGQFLTNGADEDGRFFIAFGTSAAGYTNGDTFTGGIYVYNTWTLDMEGATTVGGVLYAKGYGPSIGEEQSNAYSYSSVTSGFGVLKLGGSNTTFLAGTTVDVEQGGTIEFVGNTNFTSLAAMPTINGGMLWLNGGSNTFNNYGTAGLVVASGSLAITANGSLGGTTSRWAGRTASDTCAAGRATSATRST